MSKRHWLQGHTNTHQSLSEMPSAVLKTIRNSLGPVNKARFDTSSKRLRSVMSSSERATETHARALQEVHNKYGWQGDVQSWKYVEFIGKITHENDIDSLRVLISHQVGGQRTLDYQKKFNGMNLLHIACMYKGHIDVVRWLVRNGVDINMKDGYIGLAPLLFAVSSGNMNALKHLVERGANVNVKDPSTNKTALHIIITQMQSAIVLLVRLLLSHGASVKSIDNLGQSPLHVVAQSYISADHVLVAKDLIEAGASLTVKDKNGMTPLKLLLAKPHYNPDCIELVDMLIGKIRLSKSERQTIKQMHDEFNLQL